LFHAKHGLSKLSHSRSSESASKSDVEPAMSLQSIDQEGSSSAVSYHPMVDDDFEVGEMNVPDETHGICAQNWQQAMMDGKEEFILHWVEFWGDIYYNDENSALDKCVLTCEMPFTILRQVTVPVPCDGYYCRPLVAISVALSPLWIGLYCWMNYEANIFFPQIFVAFIVSTVAGLVILRYAPSDEGSVSLALAVPVALYGFVIAATWINWIAGNLVGVLGYLGVVCHIPGSIMGMTVLAWGNSIADLTADMTMAKKGLANMAITACFAGPIFNILVGLGLGFMSLRASTGKDVIEISKFPANVEAG